MELMADRQGEYKLLQFGRRLISIVLLKLLCVKYFFLHFDKSFIVFMLSI